MQRRYALRLAPLVVPLSMRVVYGVAVAQLGPRMGYLAGFLVYWVGWCLLFSWWVCGSDGIRAMFRPPERAGRRFTGAVLLLWPLPIGFAVALPAALDHADLRIVALSVVIALVNATGEEILWRGTFQRFFPHSWLDGVVWPALGFAVWHYAPQSVFPNHRPGGSHSLVAFSLALGLSWGLVALRTRSIRWTTLVHVLFDASGLGGRMYLG
jgi:membrane protease YdiL (CAAX protease family)